MSLSDAAIRNAKPKAKPYKLADGDGLFLLVTPAGGKYWRMRYFVLGKEKLLALGVYPEVPLAYARDRKLEARRLLAAGTDPGAAKKAAKSEAILEAKRDSEDTFEAVAREWYGQRLHSWVPTYAETVLDRLEKQILPVLGPQRISRITAPDILAMLRPVEARGALELTFRLKQICGQIFRYGIAIGKVDRNPAADLTGALKTPVVKHRAYLKEDELPEFIKKLVAYDGEPQTRFALLLLMLTFVRTTELRAAQWSEIDWEKGEWRIPAERMKMKEQHVVPLARQALAALQELRKHTGDQQYVFLNTYNRRTFMSENTMLYALYRMGYHSRTTGHGFRSTASTILNENGFRADVIERQLAHNERNPVRAAYNHAQYLAERRQMMQWWADYLEDVATKSGVRLVAESDDRPRPGSAGTKKPKLGR
jgi:integrase